MKLRLYQNTLRLRLSKEEVAQFGMQGRIVAEIRLGPGVRWTYALERAPDAEAVSVRAESGGFTVLVPAAMARAWVETDQVGFSGVQDVGGGETLRFTIEKDFPCRHEPAATPTQAVGSYSRPRH